VYFLVDFVRLMETQ